MMRILPNYSAGRNEKIRAYRLRGITMPPSLHRSGFFAFVNQTSLSSTSSCLAHLDYLYLPEFHRSAKTVRLLALAVRATS